MFDGSEMMDKLARWDLEEDVAEGTDTQDAAVYKQLQSYFKNFFLYSDDISRISRQLGVVMQDFIRESGQVEQVAAFLKKGAEKQTLDIEKCVKLVEDFTGKINAIYGKSQNIISLAYDMEKNNMSVKESVSQLVLNQAKNDEAIRGIFDVVTNLIEKTQKIGEITKLINRISSETNLLGLNAKVEAARAGAAGRGFSVVADEIQRLSKESKEASVNISDTIQGVTDEITLLEKVAVNSQGAFEAQRGSVSEVSDAFEKNSRFIETYICEQKSFNTSIEEIKSDEDILVSAISSIFSSVREVSATANEITSLTYDQNNTISLFSKIEQDLCEDVSAISRENSNIKVNTSAAEKRRIAIVFDNENVFFDPTKREALKAADTYNYEISFYAPKSRGVRGTNEMAAILDDIIDQKVDGLVISPIDDELIFQRVKKIQKDGAKIVFINSKLDNIDYVSYIQTNGIAAGAAAARVVMGVMGNQGEAIVNSWSDTHISAIEDRRSGFVQELKKNTSIDVHEVSVNSKPAPEEAEKIIRSMLERFPKARFVFLTNCDWGLIFSRYMKKYRPDVEVIVVDFTKEIQDAMNSGLIHYALGQRNYSWGSMAMSFLDKAYGGKPVQKYVDTGTYEVNQQNLGIYKGMVSN